MSDLTMHQLLTAARLAGQSLAAADKTQRAAVLHELAALLEDPDHQAELVQANRRDVEAARLALARGELSQAQVDRLALDVPKLAGLAKGLRQLASLPDPIGQREVHRELDDGLILERKKAPLGLIAVVFESRPDALIQISGLCLRTGNAVALKGGSEAWHTNCALHQRIVQALTACACDPLAVMLLRDRAELRALLEQPKLVELVVARGSSHFVEHVRTVSKIPVLGHAEGLCHIYLHADAPPPLAAAVVVDAKCSYPAACNAVETLLWHPSAASALQACVSALEAKGVALRGCPATCALLPQIAPANESDWSTEYGDLVLSIRQVEGLSQAMDHISRYGSRHTEAIITRDLDVAEAFLAKVDAACVFHNASTRFADGYRFGLGAEVGVSTDKLHARGPVGIEGLCTYRWILRGNGHCTTDYNTGGRQYSHRDLG